MGLDVACVQLRAREITQADLALSEALAAADEAASRADVVVLPEATVPGYVLHDIAPHLDVSRYEAAVEAFSAVAARHKAWLAVGLVRPQGRDAFNSALLVAPDGSVAGRTDKTFLWHFDALWFKQGSIGEVTRAPWGIIGMIVCADARLSEVPRISAVQGARLILDPTALVLSPTGSNAQLDFMLAARAWENGTFLAVANKCGVEAGIAEYAGRSAVFDPSGTRLTEAAADRPEIVTATIDLDRAPGPRVPRQPERYTDLARPFDELPIARVLASRPPTRPLRLGLLGTRAADGARLIRELGADVPLGPGAAGLKGGVVPTGERFLVGGRPIQSGEVIPMNGVKVGFLVGRHGLVPEEARSAMLRGAAVIVWNLGQEQVPDFIPPTRAAENAVFLVVLSESGAWQAYGPNGARIGAARPGMEGTLLELPVTLAWNKEMVPGTDVVRGRQPEGYRSLTDGGWTALKHTSEGNESGLGQSV